MLDFKISLVFAFLTFGLLTGGMEFKSENLAYGSSKFNDAMDKITENTEKALDKMTENTENTLDRLLPGKYGDNQSDISKPYADCIYMYNQNVSITLKTDDDCNDNEFDDAVEYYKLDEFPIEKTDRELGDAKIIELVR